MATASSATVAARSAVVARGNFVLGVFDWHFTWNKREFRANAARNALPGATLSFALARAVIGVTRCFR